MDSDDKEMWEGIPAVYSPLYEKLKTPAGLFALLPMSGCIGNTAKEALDNINRYTKTKGFQVSRSNYP